MGRYYLVVVESSYLAEAESVRGAATAGMRSSSKSSRYEHRRSSLLSVAQQVLSPAATRRAKPLAESAVQALTDQPSWAASTPAAQGSQRAIAPPPVLPTGVKVLEALGAWIVEEERCDPSLLAHVTGLRLYADATIDLPAPTNAASAAAPPWHLAHIDAHGVVPGTGKKVLVGVLDSGIDTTHPEFAGKTIHFAEFDATGVQLDSPPRDAGSHGTHVCSLLAGATCGVARDAELAVAAVLTSAGTGGVMSGQLVQIAAGLNWLLLEQFGNRAAQGVDIINASLSGRAYDGYLRDALTTALVFPGTLAVAAIGNFGHGGVGSHGSPANYPEVLGVGAIDANDVVASFSEWGPSDAPTSVAINKPDLCAPGVGVVGALPGGGFGKKDGTSMAAPLVCGLAARMLETNPALNDSPAQLRNALQARAAVNPVTPNPAGNTGGLGQV